MTTLSDRLFRCKEPGCRRRDPHELDGLHNDGQRTWGYRDPNRPAWMRRLTVKELTK